MKYTIIDTQTDLDIGTRTYRTPNTIPKTITVRGEKFDVLYIEGDCIMVEAVNE